MKKTEEEIINDAFDSAFDWKICKHREYSQKGIESDIKIAIKEGIHLMQEQDNWISVEDRLPEDYCMVIGFTNFSEIYTVKGSVLKSTNSITKIYDFKRLRYSHWQPLPEPPKH